MAIRLTKNLKRIIAGQFKLGDSIGYLASVYGVSLPRIEQVIREALAEAGEVQSVPAVQPAPPPFKTSDSIAESTNFKE